MTAFAAGLCDYLLNALWQPVLVFGAAWLLTRWIARSSVRSAHRVWVCALAAEVLLPAVPGGLLASAYAAVRAAVLHVSERAPHGGHVRITVGSALAASHIATLPAWAMRSVCLLYAAMLLSFLARTGVAVLRAFLLKRGTAALPEDKRAYEVYARACERSRRGVERQQVLVSPTLGAPLTLGFLRPVILLPANLLEHATVTELEALFAHELAHIARRDFVKNLLYRIGLLPLAFHPMAWLTLDGITETREMICDEMAAQMHGERPYARSLLQLAALVAQPQPPAPLHAIGLLDAQSFERRIMRLTTKTNHAPRRRALQFAAVAVLSTVTCASAMAFHIGVEPPRAPQQEQATGNLRVAAGVMAGQKISGLNPIYPPEAKADRVAGSVKLHAIIGEDGSITELTLLQSVRADVDISAMDAVRTWRYRPYLLNGQPTAVDTVITVTYNLGND